MKNRELPTEKQLIVILNRHCGERGDSEGAVETLERIIAERDMLLRNLMEYILKNNVNPLRSAVNFDL